jgi:hypothetical protein
MPLDSGSSYFAVVPSDTNAQPFRGLYVGGTGNVTIKNTGGQTATFNAVPVGTTLLVTGQFVMATGTSATLITGIN